MTVPLTLLVVDDHKLFIDAIKLVLVKLADNVDIFDAPDGGTAMDIVKNNTSINLILLDLDIPGLHGTEVLKILVRDFPLVPVIALTGSSNLDDMNNVITSGAMGFIHKSTSGEIMLSAIKLVLAGGIYIPKEMVANNSRPKSADNNPNQDFSALPKKEQAIHMGLTPRQFDVICYLLRGNTNKTIGRALNMSENTVKAHVTTILKVMAVGNRNEVPLALEKLGWDIKHLAR